MTVLSSEIEGKAVSVVRVLGAELPSIANSGHPGAPMGCAAIGYALYARIMKHNPANPDWAARDRFVLSNGHACALQYSLLHLTGYDISRNDLGNFRQLHSKTPGHPETNHHTPGIEVTTGPLGQGFAAAVGLAMAQRQIEARYSQMNFGQLFQNKTFVLLGDGCMQEGITSEAASLAGHLRLSNLVALYDDNLITIDGPTDLSFTEDVKARYESYGWRVVRVSDGHTNVADIVSSVASAVCANVAPEDARPTLICVRTEIGHMSSAAGTHGVHGSPLKADDLRHVRVMSGLPADPIDGSQLSVVPDDVASHFADVAQRGRLANDAWNALFAEYAQQHPELAKQYLAQRDARKTSADPLELCRALARRLVAGRENDATTTVTENDVRMAHAKPLATRQAGGLVLNAAALELDALMGGSADLTPSNLTSIASAGAFQAQSPEGSYVSFGVREHAMAAICNGISAYGMHVPFCATFLNFLSYAAGAITLSALSRHQVLYVATHDSIALGEDGPTHQPTNTLAMLRALPNISVFRPADLVETIASYGVALANTTRPAVMALSRQALPVLSGSSFAGAQRGAYAIFTTSDDSSSTNSTTPVDAIVIATGSEVALAIDAAKHASAQRHLCVRVVSMPSLDLFESQTLEYRLSVLLPGVPVLGVEALSRFGWDSIAHFTHALTSFGLSAPANMIAKELGFTPTHIADRLIKVHDYYKTSKAPLLAIQRPSLDQLQ